MKSEECYLELQGILTDKIIDDVLEKIRAAKERYNNKIEEDVSWSSAVKMFEETEITDRTLFFFSGFSSFDIPVGTIFTAVEKAYCQGERTACKAVMKASILHLSFVPLWVLEKGHKAICLMEFPEGIPDIIAALPRIEQFHESRLEERVQLFVGR